MSPKLSPIMLVDAYNVIGRWHELSQLSQEHSFSAARDAFIEKMSNYTALEKLATTLVFDAHHQDHKGCSAEITPYLRVYFTERGQTADAFIERQCAELRHQHHVIVVTSDRAQGWTAKGYGAELRSAEFLVAQVTTSMHRLRQQESKPTIKPVTLAQRSRIKPSDRAKLERLRRGRE